MSRSLKQPPPFAEICKDRSTSVQLQAADWHNACVCPEFMATAPSLFTMPLVYLARRRARKPRVGRLRILTAGLVLMGALAVAAPASACPDCAVGQQARSEVWNEHFGPNLFVALLPFLFIGAICVRAEGIGRPRASTEEVTDNDFSATAPPQSPT